MAKQTQALSRERQEYIRDQYITMRREVRKRIIEELKNDKRYKDKIQNIRGGQGRPHYKNGKKKIPPLDFDNRIWQWIEVSQDDLKLNIDLQAFDRDKTPDKDTKFRHYHVLFDRIQFRCDDPELYVITQFDAYSLTEAELTMLDDGLITQFDEFCDFAMTFRDDPQAVSAKHSEWKWRIISGNPWQ